MDRADKFINNRAPRRLLVSFLLLFLLIALLSFVLSAVLADSIVSEQIAAMLAATGSDVFTATPSAEAVAAGEKSLIQYGIHADMDPSLMENYSDTRWRIFGCMLLPSGIFCVLSYLLSLHHLNRIYNDLEALRSECMEIADQLRSSAALRGEDFGCVRRICESVNLLAERMQHYAACTRQEKDYLKDFLTDFSHQMKTSLAVIRLNSDMITEMEQLPKEKKQALSKEIVLHLDSMEELVLSALKLAKLGADAVVYEKQEADFSETCLSTLRRIQPLLRDKHIIADFYSDSCVLLVHDALWLGEAIANILKNAADHGACHRIVMELEDLPGIVKLSITDDGVGITQAEIPHLFERFGKKSHDGTMKSAGVGMAIAKQIIQAHDGDISVYSESGKGTRFEILFLK